MPHIQKRIRDRLPTWLYQIAHSTKSYLGVLRPSKTRSYWHGYLFDRSGPAYKSDGMTFVFPPDAMPRSFRARFYFDVYERPERDLVAKHLHRSAVVLEIGACIGVVSCAVNKLLDNPQSHVSVEPNPALIPFLATNRTRNGCHFIIEQCLVSRDPRGRFYVGRLMTANRVDARHGRPLNVPTKSVEVLESTHGLQFDTLVLDIEGAELPFLQENECLLSRVRLVILEVHEHTLGPEGSAQVRTLLRNAGLRFFEQREETEVWLRD